MCSQPRCMSSSPSEAAAILFDFRAREPKMHAYSWLRQLEQLPFVRKTDRKLVCGLGLRDHPFFGRSDGRVGFPQRSALGVIARTDRHGIIIFMVVVTGALE